MANEDEGNLDVKIPAVSETLESIRDVKNLYEARAGNSTIVSQIMNTA
jgi:hypothetical protein